MILRAENEFLLAAIESVYGTAPAMTGADAIQCDFEITPMEAVQKERAFSRPYYGSRAVILSEIHRAIKLSNIEMAGSGAAGTAPAWTRLMRGCGWGAVTTPTETTFTPQTNSVDSLALNPTIDGERFGMVGARGTASFMWDITEFPKMDMDFKGGWVDPETLLSLPTLNFDAWKIPRIVNCENTDAIDIGGEDYPFYSFKVEQNSTLEFYCVPGEAGYRVERTNRNMKGTLKLQAKKISDHDIFALVKSMALVPISVQHGQVAGEIVIGAAPGAQFLNPRKSDYKGDLAWELDVLFPPTAAGNNEFTVVTK